MKNYSLENIPKFIPPFKLWKCKITEKIKPSDPSQVFLSVLRHCPSLGKNQLIWLRIINFSVTNNIGLSIKKITQKRQVFSKNMNPNYSKI
jgi:hypothetical protein